MQAKRNVVTIGNRRTLNPPTHTRHELRGNVLQWRADAKASRTVAVPRPGEDGTPELVSSKKQNAFLLLVALVALVLFGGRAMGLV